MKILITENGYLCDSYEKPIQGRTYYLFDAEEFTQSMRNLWEALVDIWFRSGKFNYDTIDKYRFREYVKRDYGEGFGHLQYVDENFEMVECKTSSEIPDDVALDFANGNTGRIKGVIKSTTAYTKKQFSRLIDNTINAMHEHQVDSPKFQDIIDEINRDRE